MGRTGGETASMHPMKKGHNPFGLKRVINVSYKGAISKISIRILNISNVHYFKVSMRTAANNPRSGTGQYCSLGSI